MSLGVEGGSGFRKTELRRFEALIKRGRSLGVEDSDEGETEAWVLKILTKENKILFTEDFEEGKTEA